MAPLTLEVPALDDVAGVAAAQKAPMLDDVITLLSSPPIHRLMFLRLLPPSWVVPLPSWAGCEKISRAPTPAWWPGAWSWSLAGSALTPLSEKR